MSRWEYSSSSLQIQWQSRAKSKDNSHRLTPEDSSDDHVGSVLRQPETHSQTYVGSIQPRKLGTTELEIGRLEAHPTANELEYDIVACIDDSDVISSLRPHLLGHSSVVNLKLVSHSIGILVAMVEDRSMIEVGNCGERLQKVLAAAGVGSRRECEVLIEQGRVMVDGRVISLLGTRVDPTRQKIQVDGETIRAERPVYYLLNKPKGILTTNYDPGGRPRVLDLMKAVPQRLFSVGRLDRESEGLLLLTNDGDLSNRLTHPRYGVPKTYIVQVAGRPSPEELARLRKNMSKNYSVFLNCGRIV